MSRYTDLTRSFSLKQTMDSTGVRHYPPPDIFSWLYDYVNVKKNLLTPIPNLTGVKEMFKKEKKVSIIKMVVNVE